MRGTPEAVRAEITNGLTALIVWHKSVIACESRHPAGGDVDASDDRIRDYKERVEKLRKIREEFENVFD